MIPDDFQRSGGSERRVLVTGAGSGIGLSTSLALARVGFEVFGSVRTDADTARLTERAAGDGLEVHPLVFDLAHPESYVSVVERLDLWALVNNAGYPNAGALEDVPLDEARTQLEVIAVAPVQLTLAALPFMRKKGAGRIVNVGSVAVGSEIPLLGWYRASKHSLAGLTETLRNELSSSGVTVVAIEPGFVDTPIWQKARGDLERRFPGSWQRASYERAIDMIDKLRPSMRSADAVARVVVRALTDGRPRSRYTVGPDAMSLRAGRHLIPQRFKDRSTRQVMRG